MRKEARKPAKVEEAKQPAAAPQEEVGTVADTERTKKKGRFGLGMFKKKKGEKLDPQDLQETEASTNKIQDDARSEQSKNKSAPREREQP